MNKYHLLIVAMLLCAATSARAELIDIYAEYNQSATVPGYVVNDVRIDFTDTWVVGQMYTEELAPGSILHDTSMTAGVNFHSPFLSLNDSYFANGGLTITDPNYMQMLEIGAAINLYDVDRDNRPAIFDDQQIDFTWSAGTGSVPYQKTGWLIGHIILKDTVNAPFKFLIATDFDEIYYFDSTIVNGRMFYVPEPATMALLAMGGLAIRRRK